MTAMLTVTVDAAHVVMSGGGVRMVMTPDQSRQLARDLALMAAWVDVMPQPATKTVEPLPAAAAGAPCGFCGGGTQRA